MRPYLITAKLMRPSNMKRFPTPGLESRPSHALPPGKGALVPIRQKAGWAPEPVCQRLEEKSLASDKGSKLGSSGRPVRSQTLY
jgi:hypothetical protein